VLRQLLVLKTQKGRDPTEIFHFVVAVSVSLTTFSLSANTLTTRWRFLV